MHNLFLAHGGSLTSGLPCLVNDLSAFPTGNCFIWKFSNSSELHLVWQIPHSSYPFSPPATYQAIFTQEYFFLFNYYSFFIFIRPLSHFSSTHSLMELPHKAKSTHLLITTKQRYTFGTNQTIEFFLLI